MNRPLLIAIVAVLAFVAGVALTNRNTFPAPQVASGLKAGAALFGSKPAAGSPEQNEWDKAEEEYRRCVEADISVGTDELYTYQCDETIRYPSRHLNAHINVLRGVFNPHEAEWTVLPIMEHNPELFAGKRVMEIGTGSGLIALYAAKLGASKVVATDINQAAIDSATMNAKELGFADVFDARLVPLDDMSAYSVIGPDEQFDLIISNPPFALDLDADANSALTDRGDLGFSIVRGLEQHLAPGGVVVLLYDSLFYHQVMAKFADYSGYDVRHHNPNGLYPWAAETLFNSYLVRLLEADGLPADAFRFDRTKDQGLTTPFLRNFALRRPYREKIDFEPLLPESSVHQYYPGILIIRRASDVS